MIRTEQIFKYRIKLSKIKGSATHHEKRKILKDALLLSGLKCVLNKNNPRFNLGPGAAVDEASLCEFADICLSQETEIETIKLSLAPHITGGFKIESVKEVPYMISSVDVLASYARYNIKGVKLDTAGVNKSKTIEYEVTHPNGMREFKNIKPYIYRAEEINGGEIEIVIKLEALRSLCMARILMMLPGIEVNEPELEILRSALLWQSADGALHAV